MDDVTLGEMLTAAHRGQVDYCLPGGVSVSQSSSSVMFDGSGQPDGERNVDQLVIFGVTRFSEDIQIERMVDGSGQPDERNSSNAQLRTLLEEQRQTIIAQYREKVGHHELQAAHAEEERRLLQGQQWRQKLEFREAHQRSLTEMEELRKFQSSIFDTMARRKLIEDQNTILELGQRVQELQNEVNCMSDPKDFQDAESVRSGNSHVTSRPVSFPPHPLPGGMLSRSIGMPSRKDGPPSIWDTHGMSGNVFVNPDASSSAPYPQELNQWNSSTEEPLHSTIVEKSERPEQNQDLRCQSGPSVKDSVIFSGGDSSKNYGAFQQRLQISDLHFDKFPTPATFVCWKIRFKTEVCTCSQFPTEAMQWIKEVEMVDSVDELKSSSSVRGISMPNFEVLDARTASALNKIIHNSHFKRRISLEEQKAQKQEIRNKNFGARNGNYERNDVVKNQGTKQRVQRILGDCWQWETNGQCVKGDNCSFRHNINKRGKLTQSNTSPSSFMQQNERKSSRTRSPRGESPSGRMSRWPCKDYLKGTCNNSYCEKWHPPECLFYKTKSGCRFG